MKKSVDTEIAELERDVANLLQAIEQAPREKVVYGIVKIFFCLTNPSEKTKVLFQEWLIDGRDPEAKEKAIERVFYETLDGAFPAGEDLSLKKAHHRTEHPALVKKSEKIPC